MQESTRPVSSPWGLTPDEVRDGLARLKSAEIPEVPGTPPEWRAGVVKLRAATAPLGIDPHRWDRYRYDALRLLYEQGVELHAAGWDSLELFGLHRIAPDRRPDAMGVAWLMRDRVIVGVSSDSVSLSTAAGVVTRASRMGKQARLEAVVAWALGNG